MCDRMSGRLGAMRGSKRIHHKYITKGRHFLRKRVIVSLLAHVETHVFTKHHLARSDINTVEPVRYQPHGLIQQGAQMFRHGC